MSNYNMKSVRGHATYAGLLVSNNVRRIWITLTIADSFFSLSKMLDSSCSTVSCLRRIDMKMRAKQALKSFARSAGWLDKCTFTQTKQKQKW